MWQIGSVANVHTLGFVTAPTSAARTWCTYALSKSSAVPQIPPSGESTRVEVSKSWFPNRTGKPSMNLESRYVEIPR